MNLTKGEFSLFNYPSQILLLSEKGIIIAKQKINDSKEIRIYLIYDFFVEVFYNTKLNTMEKINLNSNGISEIYFE